MQTSDKTLAQIATTLPGAAGIFRRHRLDFCCNGHRTLEEACGARDVDVGAVEAELSALVARQGQSLEPLRQATPAQLVDHIVERYHRPLRVMLDDLLALSDRVERRHAENPDCPRGLTALLSRGVDELLSHMLKEEEVLFPAVRRGLSRELAGPIAVMRHEHDEHGEFLNALSELTHGHVPPEGACGSWRALYLGLADLEKELMEHVLVENHILFPRLLETPS